MVLCVQQAIERKVEKERKNIFYSELKKHPKNSRKREWQVFCAQAFVFNWIFYLSSLCNQSIVIFHLFQPSRWEWNVSHYARSRTTKPEDYNGEQRTSHCCGFCFSVSNLIWDFRAIGGFDFGTNNWSDLNWDWMRLHDLVAAWLMIHFTWSTWRFSTRVIIEIFFRLWLTTCTLSRLSVERKLIF